MRFQTALAQIGMYFSGRLIQTEFEYRNVRRKRFDVIGERELIEGRLRGPEFVEVLRIVREHQIALVAEQLRDRNVAFGRSREDLEVALRFVRERHPVRRIERVEGTSLETKHPVQDVPAIEGFRNVGMSHRAFLRRRRQKVVLRHSAGS
jgi:hypothetical protein